MPVGNGDRTFSISNSFAGIAARQLMFSAVFRSRSIRSTVRLVTVKAVNAVLIGSATATRARRRVTEEKRSLRAVSAFRQRQTSSSQWYPAEISSSSLPG